ncbi:hypothetical protein G3I24_49715, partial [Micromonospora aurantiaca]|nr:hypothetical protein [Micromonospora aurantiaca]
TAYPDVYLRTAHIRADDDIWVIGTPGPYDKVPQAYHWDGRTWTNVPVNGLPEGRIGILDMVSLSPTDAWAIG